MRYQLKLNRLNSIANGVLKDSHSTHKGYTFDPFTHYQPKYEIRIDLLTGEIQPHKHSADDVGLYYKAIAQWFLKVLQKEGIPIDIIESAILTINSEGKECIIIAQGRIFKHNRSFA
ncbi:MAG: hypothetical protein ACXAD7_04870 [Candidatus Kariarchaeaceae archaeon]|jgi:hypothetical protein